jgi:hypothetical protein
MDIEQMKGYLAAAVCLCGSAVICILGIIIYHNLR